MQGEGGDPLERLLAGYVLQEDVPDELLGADGLVRPVWANFVRRLASMPEGRLAERIAHGDRYLRDAGVYYRRYGQDDNAQRDWPLSHVPLLISEDEWSEISAGLAERADLLEKLAADLYGENRLVAEGHLPASLIAESPEWHRPLVGQRPRDGHFLDFIAFDIGRGPKGNWWVLCDRTQSPSGAGFALENRIATTRVYSDIFVGANVTRLSNFFRDFRDRLMGLRRGNRGRVGILTPGPLNATYYEHAYIARYLGFTLLEGDDLTVLGGQLMIRTIDGLQPISVLWRRLDSEWADPLELNEGSHLGTPGMLGAIRAGNVSMLNALGSGVLETRALMAFLPRLSELLDGRPLRMPNVATWWCGQESERAHVRANADQMVFSSAWATGLAHETGGVTPPATGLDAWIERRGAALVAQEQVQLSTAPALIDGALVPRPMTLRVFLARTENGWVAMPGGFARIGRSEDSSAIAMQQGGQVADVWVIGRKTERAGSLLRSDENFERSPPAALPSRAADNLFWLGRYVERSEHMVRVLRARHARLAESEMPDAPLPLFAARYLENLGCTSVEAVPSELVESVSAALGSAGHVADRFSVDGMLALADLTRTVREFAERVTPGDDAASAMGVLIRKLNGFSGLVHDNMYRFEGWRFLSIGRALERASTMSTCLAVFADASAPAGALDMAVEISDSVMTHHRRYTVATNRATVVDLLALDELNPRSILCQLSDIEAHLAHLPGTGQHRQMTPLTRAVLRARTDLALQLPDGIKTRDLERLGDDIAGISDQLTLAYLS